MSDQREYHPPCGSVHDLRVSCKVFPSADRDQESGDLSEFVKAVDSQPDMVNHPPHYTSHPSGVECITVIEWMTLNQGNAVKYLWRMFDKGDPIENLEKARWYIDREIARLKGLA